MIPSRTLLISAFISIVVAGAGLLSWWQSGLRKKAIEDAVISQPVTSEHEAIIRHPASEEGATLLQTEPVPAIAVAAKPLDASYSPGIETSSLADVSAETATENDSSANIDSSLGGGNQTPVSTKANKQVVQAEDSTVASRHLPWLSEQPHENYTIQLMVSSQRSQLNKLVVDKQLQQPIGVGRFSQNGKLLYMLLLGSYQTRKAADDAAEELKGRTGLQPWVRAFGTLPPLVVAEVPLSTKSPLSKLSGAAWLWSRDPEHHTVQLLGVSSKSAVDSYLQQHPIDGELALVKIERDGKPWYLLLRGEYANGEEAGRALAGLPVALKAVSPWSRTFASLQEEMMSSRPVIH